MDRNEVCCLTPAGACAIAVVGLRGPTVWQKIAPYFNSAKKQPVLSPVAQTYRGKLRHEELGDDVVLVLQGAADYQTIEMQLHGGPGVVAWCMQFALALGCRQIDWPQWCENNLWRMLPLATTKKTAGILLDQCHGAMERALASIRQRVSINGYDRHQLRDEVDALLVWESLGIHLIEPWKIVLAGPPNVGKSSLLNALLGFERVITSPIPGTTRDLVSATLAWDGYPMEFIDTAGLRAVGDELERAGMKKTKQVAQEADAVLWLIDLSQPEAIIHDGLEPTMMIGTKADLPRQNGAEVDLAVSAVLGTGLKELLTTIHKRLVPLEPVPGQPIPILPAHTEELHQLRQRLSE